MASMDTNELTSKTSEELLEIVKEQQKIIKTVGRELTEFRANAFSFLEAALDIIFLLDKEGNIIYRNPASEIMISADLEEIKGTHYTNYFTKSRKDAATKYFAEAIKEGKEIRNLETTLKDSAGKKIYLLANLTPVRSINGQIVGLLAIFRDITEKVTLTEKLKDNINKLEEKIKDEHDKDKNLKKALSLNEEIINIAPVGIFMTDSSGIMLSQNPALRKIMKASTDGSFIGFNLYTYKNFIDAGLQKYFDRVMENKVPEKIDNVRYVAANKETIIFNVWMNPILDTDKNVKNILFIVEDTTEHAILDARIKRAEKISAMNLMAAGISEELRMPLSHINIDISFIDNNTDESSPMKSYIKGIKEDMGRIQFVSDMLLDLSRTGPDSTRLMDAVEVSGIIESQPIKIKLQRMKETGINVVANLPKKSPVVYASKNQLIQVLIHLISNAGEAMSERGKLTITIDSIEKKFASISIEDTGIGITPENLSRIFQPFFTTKGQKGTGLGLMVAGSIIENIGGAIGIKSTPGEGTTARILIPLHKKDASGRPIAQDNANTLQMLSDLKQNALQAESLLLNDGYYLHTHDESTKSIEDKATEIKLERTFDSRLLMETKIVSETAPTAEPAYIREPEPGPRPAIQEKRPSSEKMDIYQISNTIATLRWHMEGISKKVIGRNDIIQQIIYAILCREHLLLLSRTGMAKSYLANHIFNIFSDVRIFATQASKDQTPDNYFGPYNIEEFKKGRIRHNIHGSIIESNLVLLDEFFDANDVVLRSLLSVLNERKFVNGPEQIDVAIHTAIATANYMRLNEVTEAVLDRFLFKSIIPENTDMYNQLLIDHTYSENRGKIMPPEKRISFGQISYISDIAKNSNPDIKVTIPETIYFLKNVLVNKFVSEIRKSDIGYFISPRKQAKMTDFLRASALLDGRFEANMEDLKKMYFVLTTLNNVVTIRQADKSERDVFLDVYEQIMIHYKRTGALDQVTYLLNVSRILQEVKDNPEKKNKLHEASGLLQGVRELLKKIFPSRFEKEEDISIEALKKSIIDLNPAAEEIKELKHGIIMY